MQATSNYGPIRAGREYNIHSEGYDWYLVRLRGRLLYIPKFVFERGDK